MKTFFLNDEKNIESGMLTPYAPKNNPQKITLKPEPIIWLSPILSPREINIIKSLI